MLGPTRWDGDARYPATLDAFLERCHANGQSRPTPLLLKYGPGDYNRLHQDLYGGIQFPLQAAVLLSAPGSDFDGGEFVLTETAPRRQTRAEVVPLKPRRHGDLCRQPAAGEFGEGICRASPCGTA